MMSGVVSLSSADGTHTVTQPPREIFKIFEKKYDKDLPSQIGFIWSLVSQKKNLNLGSAFCKKQSDIFLPFYD